MISNCQNNYQLSGTKRARRCIPPTSHPRVVVFSTNLENKWHDLGHIISSRFPGCSESLTRYLDYYRTSLGRDTFARRFDQIASKISSRRLEEIRNLASGLEMDERTLVEVNLIGDICRPHGCSTAVLSDSKGHVLIGHNLDWPDFELAHKLTTVLILRTPDGDHLMPGFAGVSATAMGINCHGVCFVLHDSHTHAPYDAGNAAPMGLSLRDIVETATTAEEVVQQMSSLRFAHGCMLMAVDQTGAWLLEHGGEHRQVRPVAKNERLCRTNHFHELPVDNCYEESLARYDRLVGECANWESATDGLDSMVRIMRAPGIFRPLNEENAREVRGATLHSFAYHPTTGALHCSLTSTFPGAIQDTCLTVAIGAS